MQSAESLLEASFLKATLGQRNNLRNLDLHFHKTYGHWTWQVAYFEEQFQHANAWVATKLMFSFLFQPIVLII